MGTRGAAMWWWWAAVWCSAAGAAAARGRHAFYRDMAAGEEQTRRMFGGDELQLEQFGAACALLDRYHKARCSGAVLSPRWVLTAAHCVTPRLAYVKYNTMHPSLDEGSVASILFLYRHPKYKVVQEDEGRGVDVTVLHHDVGLVRSRTDMLLKFPGHQDMLADMRRFNPVDMHNKHVQVLGFGRTEGGQLGEQLMSVRLRLVFCERGAWFYCMCGVSAGAGGDGRGRAARGGGVCSGDSGGPVLFEGRQIAITSMGPLQCADPLSVPPGPAATSVFTALHNYVDLLNATMLDTDKSLRMLPMKSELDGAAPRALPSLACPLALLVLLRPH